jgi:hypothetical protein
MKYAPCLLVPLVPLHRNNGLFHLWQNHRNDRNDTMNVTVLAQFIFVMDVTNKICFV